MRISRTPSDRRPPTGSWSGGPIEALGQAILRGIVRDRMPIEDFVGRRAELVVFEQAIVDARNGLPSVVLVGGDAGIGKTTIVSESARRADVALYLGRSTHIGGDMIPLAPLADLLRQVRRSRPDLLTDTPDLAPLHQWLVPGTVEPDLVGPPHGRAVRRRARADHPSRASMTRCSSGSRTCTGPTR